MWSYIYIYIYTQLSCSAFLRLLLLSILRAKEGAVFTFGVVCSSFVAVSRGSTFRHYFLPLGDPTSPSNQLGNLLAARRPIGNPEYMFGQRKKGVYKKRKLKLIAIRYKIVGFRQCGCALDWWFLEKGTFSALILQVGTRPSCRTMLAIIFILSRQCVWCIEQPSSSLLFRHPRFNQLMHLTTATQLNPQSLCFIYINISIYIALINWPKLYKLLHGPGIQAMLLDVRLGWSDPKTDRSVEQF